MMSNNNLKFIPFHLGLVDKIILFLFFISFSILPIFKNYVFLSTMVLLPGIAIFLIYEDKSLKLNIDPFLKKMLLIFFIAVISIIFINSLPDYLLEIKKFIGIIVGIIICMYLLKRNISNIWPLYFILFSKFIVMVYYTYINGVMTDINIDVTRLQSGSDVGINANAYGYFAFIALFSLGLVMNTKKSHILSVLFFLTFIASIYINILAASRAGLFFSVLSFVTIYLTLTFQTWKKYFMKGLIIIMLLLFTINFVAVHSGTLVIIKRYENFIDTKQDQRLIILKDGIDMISNHLLGVGAGQFQIRMIGYSNIGKYAAAHDSFLLITANYGLLGLFLFVSIFIFFFNNSLRLIRYPDLLVKKYGLMFLSFGLLFFMYNFFYDMIFNLYIMFMFSLLNYHQNYILKGIVPILKKY